MPKRLMFHWGEAHRSLRHFVPYRAGVGVFCSTDVLRQGGCGDNSESASRDLILVECLALGLLPLPIHVLRNGAAMLRRC